MPRKPSTPEQKAAARIKTLDVTLPELLAEINAENGVFRRRIKIGRKGPFVRLIIRYKNKKVPEAWAMALLLDNTRIAGIDFHQTDYTDSEGTKRVGWHQDVIGSVGTISKVSLPNFNPANFEQFIGEAFALLKIRLKPGGGTDANDQLRIV